MLNPHAPISSSPPASAKPQQRKRVNLDPRGVTTDARAPASYAISPPKNAYLLMLRCHPRSVRTRRSHCLVSFGEFPWRRDFGSRRTCGKHEGAYADTESNFLT